MNAELSGRQLADGEQMCAKTSWVQVRREQTQKERPDYTRDCGRICIFFFILVCNLKQNGLLTKTEGTKRKKKSKLLQQSPFLFHLFLFQNKELVAGSVRNK